MAEVARQLKPFHEMLTRFQECMEELQDWQLGFWSNGSGKPPGFFQMRIKADDERYLRLEKETEKQSATLEKLDDYINTAVIRQKESEDRKKDKEERLAFWMPYVKWIAGTVGTGIVGLSIWGFHTFRPVVYILWEDYLRAHPTVTEQLRNVPTAPNRAVSSTQEPNKP